MESADDAPHNGETKEVKRKIIIEAVQEYLQEKKSQSRKWHETAQEWIPPVIPYTVKKGDWYYKIIKEEIFKNYYEDLYKSCDKELLDAIVIVIEKDTGIKNEKLKEWQKLTIHTENIKTTINNYLNNYLNNNWWNNWHETAPQQQTQPQTQPQQQPQTPEQGQSIETFEKDYRNYKIQKGNNIEWIVINKILRDDNLISKYNYPELTEMDKTDRDLIEILKAELRNQNGGKDGLIAWNVFKINMKKVTQKIQEYLDILNDLWWCTPLTSMKQFNASKNPVIKRLRDDNNNDPKSATVIVKNQMKDLFAKNQTINIPKPAENRNSKKYDVEDITKPDSAIMKKVEQNERKYKLAGKTFILDAWHWECDPWTIWLVQDKGTKERFMMFESAIALDITYRTAQLLRACWATVELTHYVPNRWISNEPDLPPCLGLSDKKGASNALFTDVAWDKNKDYLTNRNEFSGDVKGDKGINHRKKLIDQITENKGKEVDMFMSFHMDSDGGGKGVNYEMRDPKKEKSKKFADHLKSNWFWDTVSRGPWGDLERGVWVLQTDCPSVLLEMWSISNPDDAAIFRDPQQRQKKAEDLVKAMVGYSR